MEVKLRKVTELHLCEHHPVQIFSGSCSHYTHSVESIFHALSQRFTHLHQCWSWARLSRALQHAKQAGMVDMGMIVMTGDRLLAVSQDQFVCLCMEEERLCCAAQPARKQDYVKWIHWLNHESLSVLAVTSCDSRYRGSALCSFTFSTPI